MVDLATFWDEIISRPLGPMAFRVYMQPFMATLFAFRDGRRDAKARRPPYFRTLFFTPEAKQLDLIRSGWRSIGKLIILAIVLDVIYQLTVLKGLRPVEGLVMAVLLAIFPYTLMRGLFNRFFTWTWRGSTAARSTDLPHR